MAGETTLNAAANKPQTGDLINWSELLLAIRNGLLTILGLTILAWFLQSVLEPIINSTQVEQTVTTVLARTLIFFLPFAAYIATSLTLRPLAKTARVRTVVLALMAAAVMFGVLSVGHYVFKEGPFAPRTALQFTLSAAEEGAAVVAVVPGGAADEAGIQVGDVITGIRRESIDAAGLQQRIATSGADAPLRLRIQRGDEEIQLTARTVLVSEPDVNALISRFVVGMMIAVGLVFWPGGWTPYIILVLLLSPLLAGYLWLIIATFSYRTEGLLPVGGLSLNNWGFLAGEDIAGLEFTIWRITLNSLAIAVSQMVMVLLVSSLTGYALSRMNFAGRKAFLSFTLILHGFPAITLLIPVFFILRNIGSIPVIGGLFGFNTVGGIALAMVAFELPLGVWLMKGFFDNIPWDMERSALIDGASRFRTYWEILLPQIRPGLLALGIFAFISGWNAYIIPQTYSVGSQASNLTVFMNQLIDETAPTNWNQVAAVGLFQLIPIFIFFIFAQEYLLNIYAGGSKGSS
jgi:inositol-phosphate transport system permease protein